MLQAAPHVVADAACQFAARSVPAEPEVTSIVPPQPKSIRDTGLDAQLVKALLAKAIHQAGQEHLPVLAGKLRLSLNVLREALGLLMAEQVVEVAARGDADFDVQYRLTGPGKAYVANCLAQCPYVGPAPVTLDAYRAALARDALRHARSGRVDAALTAAVLAGDGIGSELHGALGAALHSRRPLLLHGPSGSGKSTLARKLAQLLPGVVCVPHAVLVGKHIVQLHNRLVHLAPLPQPLAERDERRNCDGRWNVCRRPLVMVGAELSAAMFELRDDAANGVLHAPCQLQASGGLCVIDDLGRQRRGAAELLNRFIGPLDQGIDLLTLPGGHSEPIPFTTQLLLVTSLAPQAMLDEPLLRRIGYQVQLGPLSEAGYCALLRRLCGAANMGVDEAALAHLLALHAASLRPLLAGYPRELLGYVADFASFAGTPARLTIATLERAWRSMFGPGPERTGLPAVAAAAHDIVLFGEQA